MVHLIQSRELSQAVTCLDNANQHGVDLGPSSFRRGNSPRRSASIEALPCWKILLCNIFWEVLMWSMKGWHWQFPKITDKVLNDLLWIEIQVHIYCSRNLCSTWKSSSWSYCGREKHSSRNKTIALANISKWDGWLRRSWALWADVKDTHDKTFQNPKVYSVSEWAYQLCGFKQSISTVWRTGNQAYVIWIAAERAWKETTEQKLHHCGNISE